MRPGRARIEDDYDAGYRYDRRPVGALQALDPGRVAYLGSTSKTLSPALRLGQLITPANWHTAITNLRPGLVLGYAGLATEAINDGIAELAALINLAADGDREATRPQQIGLR